MSKIKPGLLVQRKEKLSENASVFCNWFYFDSLFCLFWIDRIIVVILIETVYILKLVEQLKIIAKCHTIWNWKD